MAAATTSLPLWERGLKSQTLFDPIHCVEVAPPVGAWIEILYPLYADFPVKVAPPVGAWIEILGMPIYCNIISVAPPVGAWIEMYQINDLCE